MTKINNLWSLKIDHFLYRTLIFNSINLETSEYIMECASASASTSATTWTSWPLSLISKFFIWNNPINFLVNFISDLAFLLYVWLIRGLFYCFKFIRNSVGFANFQDVKVIVFSVFVLTLLLLTIFFLIKY